MAKDGTPQEDSMNNTPRDIDTKLSEIYEPYSGAIAAIERSNRQLDMDYVKRNPARRTELEKTITDAKSAIAILDKKAQPLEAIYHANPWTRFFLVPGGHLHRSRRCSTLRWNTVLYWLPEYSGKTEADIVALAGEKACTVCYPSAPVDRPSQLPIHKKERAEKAAEEQAKAEARAAKLVKAINADGSEWKMREHGMWENFKTIRAVELTIMREMDNQVYYGAKAESTAAIQAMADKLQERTGKPAQEIIDGFQAKVNKKHGIKTG